VPAVGIHAVCEDIARCVDAASSAPLNSADTICGGTLGRIEMLLEAYRRLGYRNCYQRACSIAAEVVHRAAWHGFYAVEHETRAPAIYSPSLHQGMAGIGYQLLRVADPMTYASVLCFE
jgi:lantibiotic modifying enzyme